MTTYTISPENRITAWSKRPAEIDGTEAFDSLEAFTALAEAWPGHRLVTIWNHFPGAAPIKKFTNRYTGVTRIWGQLQYLTPTPAPEPPASAPKKAKAPKGTELIEDAPTARDRTKKAQVIELLRRPEGATLDEIMATTGWLSHTVRGFMAGTLKKIGLKVESFRSDDKVRTYRIPS